MKSGLISLGIFLLFPPLPFAEKSSGVNLSLGESLGARYSAISQTYLGMKGDESSLIFHPAGINDVTDLLIMVSHSKSFGNIQYDNINGAVPLDQNSTLAFAVTRVATDTKMDIRSTTDKIDGHFNPVDYTLSSAFSRKWRDIDFGVNLHLLYRELEQKGMGIRGDISAQYRFYERFLAGILYKGLIPSSARWESDHFETEPPEMYLGVGAEFPSEYFYGIFAFAYQTEGMFQKNAKSEVDLEGKRIYENPLEVMRNGNFGVEYRSEIGLDLRMGLPQFSAKFSKMRPSFGIGYQYHMISVDYSFVPHLELVSTHRLSLTISPFFQKNKFKRSLKPLNNKESESIEDTPKSNSNQNQPRSDSEDIEEEGEEVEEEEIIEEILE